MDVTVQLDIQIISEENFQEMRSKRKAILVAMSPKTNENLFTGKRQTLTM